MKTLAVLVPRVGTPPAAVIDRGSAIVTDWSGSLGGPTILVYYEGNRYGNLPAFEDRVTVAAGRLRTRYPTIARAHFNAADFVEIGTVVVTDDGAVERVNIFERATLDRWGRP